MKNNVYVYLFLLFIFILNGCKSEGYMADPDYFPYIFVIDTPLNNDVYYDILDTENFNLPFGLNLMPIKLKADFSAHPNFEINGDIYWRSCTDGLLGKGAEIVADLSIGTHRLYAEHSDTRVPDIKSVIIEVKEPEDFFYRHKEQEIRRIREVRGQDGRVLIADFDNDLIIDTSTGLMWRRRPAAYEYNYFEALNYARTSNFAGFENWRLPTYKEFKDISNLHRDGRVPTINQVFTCRYGGYWTSTPYDGRGRYYNDVYILTFERIRAKGYRYLANDTFADVNSKFWVRLVRNIN